MIKIKTIVEITGMLSREELRTEFQKMSLKDLRNYCLNNKSDRENAIKDAVCSRSKVHIKDVEVSEE